MARTPVYDSVRRAFMLNMLADRPGSPPLDELIDMYEETRRESWTRRRFLQTAAAAGLAATAPGLLASRGPQAPVQAGGAASNIRIVIVGAGIAGLNAAYKLKKAGFRALIYEGSARHGGRMFTGQNLLGSGLWTELGGEFIDSAHHELRSLAREFGLELLDFRPPAGESLKRETYFFGGRHYSEAEAIRAYTPLSRRIRKDYRALGKVINFEHEGHGRELDQLPLDQYLDRIGVTGWIRELLSVVHVTQYGRDLADQSALNLVRMISTNVKDTFEIFADSDERYKVTGGNQRIADQLAQRLTDQIRLRHRLQALQSKGKGFTLTFEGPNGSAVDVDADVALITIPFTLLREVDIRTELPAVKSNAIRALGYGTNAKVLVGFQNRHWRDVGYLGTALTDEPFQLAWDNSRMQKPGAGGLTLFSGGMPGLEAGKGTPQDQVNRLIPGLERAFPGCTNRRSDKVGRFHWPSYIWTKGSYSCYLPGQWTTIAGAEGRPVGNLFFAGEHCSQEFQGYMNGGAQTGKEAAEAIIALASGRAKAAARG